MILLIVGLVVWRGLDRSWQAARQEPVQAMLVLGGSIRREMVAVEWAAAHPDRYLLLSAGAPAPCVQALFERAAVPSSGDRVWLETCARSTLDNFRFALPILQRWQVHHVVVLTSPQHLPRARGLARLILGSHGLWVDMAAVSETGVPANREHFWVMAIDLARGLVWAIVSHVYAPTCTKLESLSTVDLDRWCQQGFKCEHQANLDGYCRRRSIHSL